MGNPIGARKSDSFKAVSTAPSFNKTPVGSSTPALPYPTVADLSNSIDVVSSVRFNGDPAYVLDQTTQPTCKGDEAGSLKGVRSGTVNGEVKPVKGSSTVRAGGKPVVRQGDPCTMNGGNNPGIYTTAQVANGGIVNGAPTNNTDPPIKAETPEEKSWLRQWWDKTKNEVSEAVQHPGEAAKGAVKGILNIPSDIGETLMKGATLQSAGEMEQAAAMQSLFGQTTSAQELMQTAQQVRSSADAIELQRFKMSNPAQAGGDKIVTAASLLAGGAGVVRSGVRGVSALGKTAAVASEGAGAAKEASAAAKVLGSEKALADEAAKAGAALKEEATVAQPAGDGVKIVKRERLKPGTPEHKADRWKKYQERGGEKDYEQWSKQYDTNMRNYKFGAAREADYRSAMGASEGTLKTSLTNRQIDILKADEMYAGQLKTGPVSLTKENITAIQKDAELVKQGWQVEHILEKGASKSYLEALKNAEIDVHIGPKIP
ncbi:hypothetical protein Hrubri_1112 [Herbaspirillum rubrisubalbicans M1]|uniref:DUF4150 domain-containing protein n=2 Tax=Herbaspirillum rubrisubalbicans TaxID=80842 RepID=UPI00073A04F6|nr:DUF4150 domain-containing protein [Herbaspirillum rubrisubalbicans]ALU88324.1 hypothetical protein Hrubri_1112 [Herbaspirillum rubrisubalbicans M1]